MCLRMCLGLHLELGSPEAPEAREALPRPVLGEPHGRLDAPQHVVLGGSVRVTDTTARRVKTAGAITGKGLNSLTTPLFEPRDHEKKHFCFLPHLFYINQGVSVLAVPGK